MTDKMSYIEFLKTVSVLRMLFGKRVALLYFTKNASEFRVLSSTDISKLIASSKEEK